MNANEAFRSGYFSAGNMADEEPTTVTIHSAQMEEVGQEKQLKLVVRFEEDERGLVLNKTNLGILIDALGKETNDWRGQYIKISVADVQFGGKRVPGLRVQPVGSAPPAARRAPTSHSMTQPTYPSAQAAPASLPVQNQPAAEQITPEQIVQMAALATSVWGNNSLVELQTWLGCRLPQLTAAQATARISDLEQMQTAVSTVAADAEDTSDQFANEGEPGYVPTPTPKNSDGTI